MKSGSDATTGIRIARIIAASVALTGFSAHSAGARDGECTDGWPAYRGELVATLDGGGAVVGEPLSFKWRIGAGKDHVAETDIPAFISSDRAIDPMPAVFSPAFDVPAYLVVAVPEAVRFEGRGFFAIAKGARGPYGMTFGADRTRAIVPLTTAFSQTSGQIDILPYVADEFEIEWAIVQADACGERVSDQSGAASADILPGAPRLVGHDRFAAATPDETIEPFNGDFEARQFGDSIEVRNRKTGEAVLATTGIEPVFSPTGRFLKVQTAQHQIVDIFDLVAERRVGRFHAAEAYWSHADSLLYTRQEYAGGLRIVRTLHGSRDAFDSPAVLSPLTPLFYDERLDPEYSESAVHVGVDPASEDMDPGESGASFAEVPWLFEISLEGGVAAFVDNSAAVFLDPSTQGYDPSTSFEEAESVILDLGMLGPMKRGTKLEIEASMRSSFGIVAPILDRWEVHGKLVSAAYVWEDEDDGMSEAASASDDASVEPGVEEMTGEETASDPYAAMNVADDVTQDVYGEYDEADAMPVSSSQTRVRGGVPLGGQWPGASVAATWPVKASSGRDLGALRSGRDDTLLADVGRTLNELVDPDILVFAATDEFQGYGTSAFPDLSAPLEGGPLSIDLTTPGRDTWAWSIGTARYWLTQTIESGRVGHAFTFTMLGHDGQSMRSADLLDAVGEGEQGLVQLGDARTSLDGPFTAPSIVSVADERYLMLATKPVVRLIAFDLRDWRPVCAVKQPRNESGIERLALLDSGRFLVQYNGDGRVEVYSCADGTPVASGILADGELVVTDPHGSFDGSEDAVSYVEMKLPGVPGRQLLSQYMRELRVPGLLQRMLAGDTRGGEPRRFDPPVVVATAAPDGTIEIAMRARSGLKALRVLFGGKIAREVPVVGNRAKVVLRPEDVGGGLATFLALDARGLASAPVEVVVGNVDTLPRGRLIGLAIGVDHYPLMPGSDLRFAVADARRIASVASKAGFYESVSVETLIDDEVSQDRLMTEVDRLVAAADPGDTLLLSFAGHGLVDSRNQLRLALTSTDVDDLESTSLDFGEIAERVRAARARVLILLDVCHAGASSRVEVASNDDAIRQLVTESGAGIVVLSASKGSQFSEELPGIDGGRFSVALEHALWSGREDADVDDNGRISVNELFRSVKASVAAGSGGRQVPALARNEIYGDFDIF